MVEPLRSGYPPPDLSGSYFFFFFFFFILFFFFFYWVGGFFPPPLLVVRYFFYVCLPLVPSKLTRSPPCLEYTNRVSRKKGNLVHILQHRRSQFQHFFNTFNRSEEDPSSQTSPEPRETFKWDTRILCGQMSE